MDSPAVIQVGTDVSTLTMINNQYKDTLMYAVESVVSKLEFTLNTRLYTECALDGDRVYLLMAEGNRVIAYHSVLVTAGITTALRQLTREVLPLVDAPPQVVKAAYLNNQNFL